MRQNKSYELYTLMPGDTSPAFFCFSQDHWIIACRESAKMLLNLEWNCNLERVYS
jgi:hypothetical protein